MSYQDGWDALNLRMPPRVPHYEPSLYQHWGVLKRLNRKKGVFNVYAECFFQ